MKFGIFQQSLVDSVVSKDVSIGIIKMCIRDRSTDHNPTIEDNKTVDGTGTGEFISTLTGLTPEVTYYPVSYTHLYYL